MINKTMSPVRTLYLSRQNSLFPVGWSHSIVKRHERGQGVKQGRLKSRYKEYRTEWTPTRVGVKENDLVYRSNPPTKTKDNEKGIIII